MSSGKFRDRAARAEVRSRLALYEHARELLDFMVENDGHVAMSKTDVAYVMYQRTARSAWLRSDGRGDRRLVEEICTLSREQREDPIAEGICAGYVIAYAPSLGGLTLVDESGEMPLNQALHFLAGDLQQQQHYKTVWRRRLPAWAAAERNAVRCGDHELARLLGRIHDKIEETGFTPDQLVREYAAALSTRGSAA